MSKKISQLTTATDVTVNDFFQVVDLEDPTMASSGTNKKVSARTLGNNLPVTATGSSASRSLKDRFADTVNVKDFGAVGDGVADDTAAIQAALNSGANAVFIPPNKTYLFSTLVIPNIFNFTLFGSGPASKLKMKSGGSGIIWAGNAGSVYYMQGTLSDFSIDGTNGSSHCINTVGVGGLDLNNIYISNVPTGYDGIRVDGFNGNTQHDIRINNYRCYSNTAGRAAISFGTLARDASVSQFIMNGNFILQYGLWFENGCIQINVTDSHPYNAGVNIAYAINASRLFFNGVVFDNATQNLVEIKQGDHINFTSCYFESIKSNKIGLNLTDGATFVVIDNTQFQGVGAASAITADSTTNGIRVVNCDTAGQPWVNRFNLQGTLTSEIGNLGSTPLGVSFGFSGVATSPQLQNTTQYLGVNGLQSDQAQTLYVVPNNGILKTVQVAVDETPAAGNAYTFAVFINNVEQGQSIIISAGNFGGSITLNSPVLAGQTVFIRSSFSATSTSATPRWSASFVG